MAYETGIAHNERDLLDKLNVFLTSNNELVEQGQNWEVLYDNTIAATHTQKERRQIVWKSTGTGVGQDIYVGSESKNNIANDIFNIGFYGATFFNQNIINNAHQISTALMNASPGVDLFADNRDFEYFFVANGRHFKILTRINNVFSSAYLGFILPTVPPTEYPYPLCVAGSAPSSDEMIRHSNTTIKNSCIADPMHGNCWLFTPDQTWRDFYGKKRPHVEITNDSFSQYIYPIINCRSYGDNNGYVMKYMSETFSGESPLYPIEFVSTKSSSQGINRWGVMEGVYWIPGVQRLAGDEVIIDKNSKGIVFNNAYRVTTIDYFMMELGG